MYRVVVDSLFEEEVVDCCVSDDEVAAPDVEDDFVALLYFVRGGVWTGISGMTHYFEDERAVVW